MLQEFLKMDQFQSQGTYSKSIFSSVEDDGEISHSVSPAGQSMNNQSMFIASSGAASSKPKTSSNKQKDSPLKTPDGTSEMRLEATKQVADMIGEVYAAAIEDHNQEEINEQAGRKSQAIAEDKEVQEIPESPEAQRKRWGDELRTLIRDGSEQPAIDQKVKEVFE